MRPPNIDEGAADNGQEDESGLMKVTTSRDPSAKARRLGKTVARFLSIPYVNRGKQSLDDAEPWLVVVEDHGNPTGLVKRTEDVEELLAFTLLSDTWPRQFKKILAVAVGQKDEAAPIAKFFELGWSEMPESALKRIIVVASGQIDFVDEGEIVLRLKT